MQTVMNHKHHEKYIRELRERFGNLIEVVSPRALKSSTEGCKKGSWAYPENYSTTKGTSMEVRLAVEDFKAILAEIKKL